MKIDGLNIFKIINELYEARKMTQAERVLIRQKKDLINYIAIHFWSFIKSILVIGFFFILILIPDQVPFSLFWSYLLTGIFFMIFDPLGIKAIIFFFKKFFIEFYKMLIKIFINIKEYITMTVINCKKYKSLKKVLLWVMMIFLFPLILILNIFLISLLTATYVIIFLLFIFFSNEALSLIITHSITRILPLDNEIFSYIYFSLAGIGIYFIIDYRIRMTEGSLYVKDIIEQANKEVIGLMLINTNGFINIYKKNNEFYVFNVNTKTLTIYGMNSKFKIREKQVTDWFKSKNNKVITETQDINDISVSDCDERI